MPSPSSSSSSASSSSSKIPVDTSFVVNVLGSSTAGLISRFLCHPIDTIKSRKQSGIKLYTEANASTASMLLSTLRNEGLSGIYRGFGAVAIGGTPGVCLYLTSYEVCRYLLVGHLLTQQINSSSHYRSRRSILQKNTPEMNTKILCSSLVVLLLRPSAAFSSFLWT
jgi:hypothetical protein